MYRIIGHYPIASLVGRGVTFTVRWCGIFGVICLAVPVPERLADGGRLGVYCVRMGMAERDAGSADGLGLADAIGLLRDELLKAQAAGAGSDIQLPVESMTVELTVTATRSVDGKAGFKVPIVELELGGGAGRERGSEQTVTVVFGGPVDRAGRPVKVAQESVQPKG
jgi:hypothetical protein